MKVFYFGCWGGLGHYVWTPSGMHPRPAMAGPWSEGDLDAEPLPVAFARYNGAHLADPARGFMPIGTHEKQPLGVWRVTTGRNADGPWTALGCWDRSEDRRLGSKAVFVAEGDQDAEAMKRIAAEHFPQAWARIAGAKP